MARSERPKNSTPLRERSSSAMTSASSGISSRRVSDGPVRELDHQVALGHAALGHVHRDPVVRQARAAQHQMAGLEGADPVADKGLAGGGRDEVQLVLVVEMPARQRRGEAVCDAAHQPGIGRCLVAERRRSRVVKLQFGLALAGQISRWHFRSLLLSRSGFAGRLNPRGGRVGRSPALGVLSSDQVAAAGLMLEPRWLIFAPWRIGKHGRLPFAGQLPAVDRPRSVPRACCQRRRPPPGRRLRRWHGPRRDPSPGPGRCRRSARGASAAGRRGTAPAASPCWRSTRRATGVRSSVGRMKPGIFEKPSIATRWLVSRIAGLPKRSSTTSR